MNIKEIYIDGFGMFNDYKRDVSQGLTIFKGQNEAGKSTILSFLKCILYGFPRKTQERNLYEPVKGGRHGGKITFFVNNEQYTVERYKNEGVKLYLPDDSIGGEDQLKNLLGRTEGEIYDNIFAFGLSELQDFKTLNTEELKGKIYSAGSGMGAISPIEVKKEFENKAYDLYKKNGKKQEIIVLLNKIKQIESELNKIENDIQQYDALYTQLEEITGVVNELELKRDDLRVKSEHNKTLINISEDWWQMRQAEEELITIPAIEHFPENGLLSLQNYKSKLDEYNEQKSDTDEDLRNITIDKSNIRLDESLISKEDAIRKLQNGLERYKASVIDVRDSKKSFDTEREVLYELLKKIGPGWDEERLSSLDISIPAREIVRKQQLAIIEAKEDIDRAESSLERVEENIKDTKVTINDLDDRLKSNFLVNENESILEDQLAKAQDIRINISKVKELEIEIKNQNENQRMITLLKPKHVESSKSLPTWLGIFIIIAGFLVGIVAYLLANVGVSIVVAPIVWLLSIIYFVFQRKQNRERQERELEARKAQEEVENTQVPINTEQQEADKNRIISIVNESARFCGLDANPELIKVEKTMEKLQSRLYEIRELKRQVDEKNKELSKLSARKTELDKVLKDKIKVKDTVDGEWNDFLTNSGLPIETTLEGTIDIFNTLERCYERKHSIENSMSRIQELEDYIQDYEGKVVSVLKGCDRNKREIDFIVEINKLIDDLAGAKDYKKKFDQLIVDENKLNASLERLEKKLEEQQIMINGLLSEGSAKSEQEFEENGINWKRTNGLKEQTKNSKSNIKRSCGGDRNYSEFVKELEKFTLEDLNLQKQELNDSLKQVQADYNDNLEKKGKVSNSIEQIENKEGLSSLLLEKEINLQELYNRGEEWATFTLASAMMDKAIKKYEREKQPAVIKESLSFFEKMTNGRYTRIIAPLGENKIRVEDINGNHKDIHILSRGTAEQLYLSLRFGFIRELSKGTNVSLPIVFDDIYVNFDNRRFEAACEAIAELVENNQILYFTCHPERASSMSEFIENTKVIDMDK